MMSGNKQLRRHYRTQAVLAVSGWIFAAIIAVTGVLVAIFEPKTDPLDASPIKSRELVDEIVVADSNRNGFRVSYATISSVTADRLAEIRSRQAVRDSMFRLRVSAPLRFGDMLRTDIYDFADFAKQFDPADISIHNIFVYGADREKLYIGDNPRLENEAQWINASTRQGLLYIRDEDIYCNPVRRRKVYRYFKCRGVNEISDTDEHFSHFTEDERLY